MSFTTRSSTRTALLSLVCAAILTLSYGPVQGAIKPIGAIQLDSAMQMVGKKGPGDVRMGNQALLPASWLEKRDTVGSAPNLGILLVQIFTPRARATRFAASAKRNNITLDSAHWNPGMFSVGALLVVSGADESGAIICVDTLTCATGGVVFEPSWTQKDSTISQEQTGKRTKAVNLQAIFPLELFNSGEDLELYIETNLGRKEVKISAKDIGHLR